MRCTHVSIKFFSLSLGVVLLILTTIGSSISLAECPEQCENCIDRSNTFNCYTRDVDTWLISADRPGRSSNVEVTTDSCSLESGETATAYIIYHDTQPCYFCYPECEEELECSTSGFSYTAVIQINGDQQAFESQFNSIQLSRQDPYAAAVVKKTGCEYSLSLLGTSGTLYLSGTAKPKDTDNAGSNANFSFKIDFYHTKYASQTACEGHPDFHHKMGSVSGSIRVKSNPRSDFNPFVFVPDVTAGSGIYQMEKFWHVFDDPERESGGTKVYAEEEWYGNEEPVIHETYECFEGDGCAGPTIITHFYGGSTATDNYRAKVPGWQKDVSNGLPPYMSDSGWGTQWDTDRRYLSLDIGSLGTFYFHSNKPSVDNVSSEYGKFMFTAMELCDGSCTGPGSSYGKGMWQAIYEPDTDKLKYIKKLDGSSLSWDSQNGRYVNYEENFTPTTNDTYFAYNWTGDTDLTVQFYDQSASPIGEWSAKFDDNGNVIESSSGCTSGCSGGSGEFVGVEYYDPVQMGDARYDEVVNRRFNKNGDILVENTHTLTPTGLPTNPNDPNNYVIVMEPFLVSQRAIKDPGGGGETIYKLRDLAYDFKQHAITEKIWVDNAKARVIKRFYKNNTFQTPIKTIEYKDLSDVANYQYQNTYTTNYEEEIGSEQNGILTTTHYTVSPSGKKRSFQETEGISGGYQVTTKLQDISNPGNIQSIQDRTSEYTAERRVTKEIDHSRSNIQTDYSYVGANYLLDTRTDPSNDIGVTGEVPTERIKVDYEYNEWDRIKEEKTVSVGTNGEKIRKVKYLYDPDTQLLEKQETYSAPGGSYASTPYETVEYRYDALGRQTRVKNADGTVTGTSYYTSGQVKSEFTLADPDQIDDADTSLEVISQTKYEYDDDGRVQYIKKAVASEAFDYDQPPQSKWVTTEYQYDFLGRRTKVIEDQGTGGMNLETTYEYNNLGELEKTTLPNGKWTKTTRDGRGLTIKEATGYGSTEVTSTTYKHDVNGNVIEVLEPFVNSSGTTKCSKTVYQYDNYDRRIRTISGIVCDCE